MAETCVNSNLASSDEANNVAPVITHRLSQPKRSILKKYKHTDTTQTVIASKVNGVLQSFKRDILGYSDALPQTDAADPELTLTQLNTSNNAALPLWKSTLQRWELATPTLATGLSSNDAKKSLSVKSIRGVRFPLAAFKVIYPLKDGAPPAEELQTKQKIHAQYLAALKERQSTSWKADELLRLYAQSCAMREEIPQERIQSSLSANAPDAPKSIDLTGWQITVGVAQALSDVLSVDFGCKRLSLENCNLGDDSLKVILHALLISASVSTLNLANNRKVKSKGWRNVATFVRKAHFLRYLDLSENTVDKRMTEWLSQAIAPAGHVDESNFPTRPRRLSSPHLSKQAIEPFFSLIPPAPLLSDLTTLPSDRSAIASLRLENCSLKTPALEALAHGVRHSPIKHISLRRNKITPSGGVALAIMIRDYPVEADSPRLSSFAVHAAPIAPSEQSVPALASSSTSSGEHSASPNTQSKYNLRQEMDHLPSVGCLLTLDIRGNDIRQGVHSIAAVLRRNRTLKVLNLDDNRIDVAGLVAIAEALRYNDTLETLDLSRNPCCGPRTDGVLALRTAFAYNSSLLRIFLAATDFSSEGAISLAEFLPEINSVIHLDLTENFDIDIAGVMALAVAVKMNATLRCLDLNIPPNEPDFARLSQDILQSCIRNTELAQQESMAKGLKQSITAPMLKSTVARNLETSERLIKVEKRRAHTARSIEQIATAAAQSQDLLKSLVTNNEPSHDLLRDALSQARAAQLQLADAMPLLTDDVARDVALKLNQNLLESCLAAETMLTLPRGRTPLTHSDETALASPAFSITDSDEDEDTEHGTESHTNQATPTGLAISVPLSDGTESPPHSPVTTQSRSWTEEEGEVFRRKNILDALDDADETEHTELSGEDLRKELLETDMPRSPLPTQATLPAE